MSEEKMVRVAIVNKDRCRPKKCRHECKRSCPVVRQGKECVIADPTVPIAFISEDLCIGCGICVKKCQFRALSIINIPKDLEKETTHRFGPNAFRLHRLPQPRPGQVLGLVGSNGTGKSTALQILGGKLKPNLGQFTEPPDWKDILRYFRGSDLQNYLKKILENTLKSVTKPQYVDSIPKSVKGTVRHNLSAQSASDEVDMSLVATLDLKNVMDREVGQLSGGELQRFAIAMVCMRPNFDVYMFDEPSSYLDVKQRLRAAQVIRSLARPGRYILCVEHDLSVLDYLSDTICCLYGVPGGYGVVTMPFSVRDGINVFLAGFIPTENMRFREIELSFKLRETIDEEEEIERHHVNSYPAMTYVVEPQEGKEGGFKLHVEPGDFSDSEIVVLLGENGTGKTTLIRLLAGLKEPTVGDRVPEMNISYKPQTIAPKFPGTVRELFAAKISSTFNHPQFQTDVVRPLSIEYVLDRKVKTLSGGELQRVAIVLALGKPSDIYLIDEPSAYLDSEQRIIAAKVIKRFILHAKKTAFVVEHDFIMATYMADRVIVYEGTPAVECTARRPQTLLTGMNLFLKMLDITFRRDPTSHRPRINKLDSVKDREQKSAGNFFFLDE